MLVAAVALGLGAAWLANAWLSDRLALNDAVAEVRHDSVVAAALEIKFGQAIEDAHVRLLKLPPDSAPNGTFSSTADVVGKIATQTILPGEFIVAGRLAGDGGGSALAAVVPEGKRAVTVRVNDVIGVAGFLLPGNRVDVIASQKVGGESRSKTLLQNVKVMAVDQKASSDKNEPVIVRAITLELSPEESEQLVAATSDGFVQMALRNPLDDSMVAKPAPPAPPAPEPAVKEVVKEVEVVKVVEKPVYRTPRSRSVTVIKGTAVAETQVR
jgi:pilus assembly protein CpaB